MEFSGANCILKTTLYIPFLVQFEQKVCFYAAEDNITKEVPKKHFIYQSQLLHSEESPCYNCRKRSPEVTGPLANRLSSMEQKFIHLQYNKSALSMKILKTFDLKLKIEH